MQKKSLLQFWILLLCMIVGGGNSAWADEITYQFTSKSWAADKGNWTSGKDGNQLTGGQGVQITTGASGANATSPVEFSNVSKVVVTYCTNASKGAGSVSIQIGDNDVVSQNVTKEGGQDLRTLEYNYATPQSGYVKLTVTCSTNSIYIYSVAISYSASDPGKTTPELSFPENSYNATMGQSFTAPTLTNESGVSVVYSSSNNDVATVDSNTGAVTLVSAGKTTITASFEGNESYNSASASYTLTVAPSPLASIALSGSYPTTFIEGSAFSHEGMTVTATYEDNTTKDVTEDAEFTGYDMSTIRVQTVTVSYTEGGVTKEATYDITVNAIPTHTVTWSVNGTTTTETCKEGATIIFPANPGDINGMTFVGWTATAITGTTDTAPEYVTSATMGNSDITYYAVFAKKNAGAVADVTDELTVATTGATSNSYTGWSGKTASSQAVYAGQSAKSNNGGIQLRSTSPSGIITTASGGKAKKIVVTWESVTTDGRTLDIYGKNSAYAKSDDLYSSTSTTVGTKLGSIIKGKSTELEISGDYQYIGLRSANGAMYLSQIDIIWTSGTSDTYSNYCTTVSALPLPEITLSAESIEMTWGDTDKVLTATAKIGEDNFEGTITLTPSSPDLTIDGEGNIRCNVPGEYTITASIAETGEYQGAQAECTVRVGKKNPALAFSEATATGDINDPFTAPTLTNIYGVPVVYSSTDTDVADFVDGVLTLKAEGTTTIKATFAADETYTNDLYTDSEVSYTLTVTDRTRPGSFGNPYTVAQARAAIDANEGINGVYVKGIVCEGGSSLSGGAMNYWISDDGTETDMFEIYKGKGKNGANFTSVDDIQVEDVVVVYGNLKKYGSTYEFDQNSQLVTLTRKAETTVEISPASLALVSYGEGDKTATLTATVKNGEETVDGATVTWESDNTAVATVSAEGLVTAVADGTAHIKAIFAGNTECKGSEGSITVTVTDSRTPLELSFGEEPVSVNVGETVAAPALTGNAGNGAVTYVSNDLAIATVDESTGVVTGVADGTTTITATVAATDSYQQGTASFTVKVIDPNKKGTENNPYTVAEAMDAIDNNGDVENVYVKGIVCTGGSNLNNGAMSYYISDDGTTANRFQIYKGKGIDGADFESVSDVQVGDIVKVFGSISLYSYSTYQFNAGSQLVSLKRKVDAELSFGETTAFNTFPGDENFTAPTLTNPHELTVTYTSSNENVAVVDEVTGEVVLGEEEGTATITANFAGNDDYKEGSASYTITLEKLDVVLSFGETTAFEVRENADFTAPTLQTNPENLTVTYSSTDESVALVDENSGEVVIGTAGDATITASFAGSVKYNAASASYTITVVAGKIAGVVTLTQESVTMNAETQKDITTFFTTNSDGVVSYETDNAEVAKVEDGMLIAVATGSANITIKVAESEDYDATSQVLPVTVTVYPDAPAFVPGAGGYVLVTDASTLKAGDKIIIVGKTSGGYLYAMAGQNSNNRAEESVSAVDRVITLDNSSKVQEITLEGETGAWYFNVGTGYLYAASSSQNHLKTEAEKDNNAKATIEIESDGAATVEFQGSNTRNKLRYNSSNGLFSCYGSTSTQNDVYIYRLEAGGVEIGASEWRTLVSSVNLSFPEEVKAYIVTETGDKAMLQRVHKVRAGVPVVLNASEETYSVETIAAEYCDNTDGNLLQVSDATTSNGVYVLANKSHGVGFYKWNGGKLGVGRVYLPAPASGVRSFIGFEWGETTGVTELENRRFEDVNTVYDLQGCRVKHVKKGSLYIVNGKKVVIK